MSFQKLIGLIEEHRSDMNPELARKLMIQSDIRTEDVMPWADFGHPLTGGYGRKMVHNGGYFEIMVMSWVPGDFSALHDHGMTQWGAVKSLGPAEHAAFDVIDEQLVTVSREIFSAGDVVGVDQDLIHQMGNVNGSPFCTIHLYGCYDHHENITGDARIFDLFENTIQYTNGGVFFCLPEDDINKTDEGIRPDYVTSQRHNAEMLRWIHRCLPHERDEERRFFFQERARALVNDLLSPEHDDWMARDLEALRDSQGCIVDADRWQLFWNELKVAADVKAALQHQYV